MITQRLTFDDFSNSIKVKISHWKSIDLTLFFKSSFFCVIQLKLLRRNRRHLHNHDFKIFEKLKTISKILQSSRIKTIHDFSNFIDWVQRRRDRIKNNCFASIDINNVNAWIVEKKVWIENVSIVIFQIRV